MMYLLLKNIKIIFFNKLKLKLKIKNYFNIFLNKNNIIKQNLVHTPKS